MAAAAPIGMGMSAAGGITKTISTIQARDVAAKSLEQEAISAENQAIMDETQSRRQSALIQGKANAVTAGSGLSLKSGTPLFMELDRAKQAEIEALKIRQQGQQIASSKRFERRMQKRAIPFDIIGGFLGAGGDAAYAAGGGSYLRTR